MVARLAQKLASNPDDGEGWIMLARTYNALGRFGDAAAAYAKAEASFRRIRGSWPITPTAWPWPRGRACRVNRKR
jgi:cytochrome c-type biogenesis protein CcmH